MLCLLSVGSLLLATPARAQNAEAGEAIFKRQCAICHSVQPGKNMIGPSLAGVVGRHAGTAPGFKYTQANRDSGKTWDPAALDTYLTDPRATIPGTTMMFAGVKDKQQRTDLIAYLGTLK
jgi:cytochrome c